MCAKHLEERAISAYLHRNIDKIDHTARLAQNFQIWQLLQSRIISTCIWTLHMRYTYITTAVYICSFGSSALMHSIILHYYVYKLEYDDKIMLFVYITYVPLS